MSQSVTGVTYFPVTPFDDEGAIAGQIMRERLSYVVDAAEFAGVFPLGSTGEFAYLSSEERKRVAEITVDEVGGSVPVFVGTSGVSTREVIDLSTHAESIGADGVLTNPQSYYTLTQQEIYRHYRRISDAIDIPIMVYDNPYTTGVRIRPELARRLADLDKVPYFKSGTGDMGDYRALVAKLDDVNLFAAPPHVFEKLADGAQGWTDPITSLAPNRIIDVYDRVQAGDLTGARERYRELRPLLTFFESNHLSTVTKAILQIQGWDVGEPRPPLEPLGATERDELAETLTDLGLAERPLST